VTKVEFSSIHDIIVNNRDEKAIITIRDSRGSDVDIIMKKSDEDFLATVLNEHLGKEKEIQCLWDSCKHNKNGYCTKNRIELTNIVVGHQEASELLDCKQFEMGDTKDDSEEA
jgi:hypothetical protein